MPAGKRRASVLASHDGIIGLVRRCPLVFVVVVLVGSGGAQLEILYRFDDNLRAEGELIVLVKPLVFVEQFDRVRAVAILVVRAVFVVNRSRGVSEHRS